MTILVALTCVLLITPLTIYAQLDQSLQQRVVANFKALDITISAYTAQKPNDGAAIAVLNDRQIIWENTYGDIDGKGSRPVDANTMFSIQSMSKSFTAVAVLMAVQDGLVDLDTPLMEYLPDFRVNSLYDEHPEELITLRLLLTHRAGFTFEAPFGSQYDERYDFSSERTFER